MHIFAKDRREPMFLNVDEAVGARGFNGRIDTLLVQFLIREAVALVPERFRSDRRQTMQQCPTNGECNAQKGNEDPTIRAILAAQEQLGEKFPGTIADGRVSSARGYKYGSGTWTIVSLNDTVSKHCLPDVYPRLDLLGRCPGELRAQVRSLFMQF